MVHEAQAAASTAVESAVRISIFMTFYTAHPTERFMCRV